MRIGILDILAMPSSDPYEIAYRLLLTKQYASITPQAISVWCREMGHQTFYAAYYGVGDVARQLPRDLDVLFVCCGRTQASPLAYVVSKLYRRNGTLTVIGGPHARSFPVDCLRFFDIVVKECDRNLIADIIAGHYDPGSVISAPRPLEDFPLVEERLPELRASAMLFGRKRYFMTIIPLLASIGCPYTCNFCVDWDSPYRMLPLDRLAADLRFIARTFPGVLIAFHDPNFAVKFDQVLEVLELLPPADRPPYIMESSLSILRGARIQRLRESNCVAIAPGIESWADYSNKAGVSRATGAEKVHQVAEHFRLLHEQVPYLQGNLIFGLDTDHGDEPVALTREFMDLTPFVWHTFNIPVPFGGTPLFDELLAAGRILGAMPFSFYYAPYVNILLRNYDPITYYEKLLEMMHHAASRSMLQRRYRSSATLRVKAVHWARTASTRGDIRVYHRLLTMLREDDGFRAFHEGRSPVLPEFYHREYERMLGRYAGMLTRADRTPDLTQIPVPARPAALHEIAPPPETRVLVSAGALAAKAVAAKSGQPL